MNQVQQIKKVYLGKTGEKGESILLLLLLLPAGAAHAEGAAAAVSALLYGAASFNPIHLSSLPPPCLPPLLSSSSIRFPPSPPCFSFCLLLIHIFLTRVGWMQTRLADSRRSLWSCRSFFPVSSISSISISISSGQTSPLQQILHLANQQKPYPRSAAWQNSLNFAIHQIFSRNVEKQLIKYI